MDIYDQYIHTDDPMFSGHASYTGGGNSITESLSNGQAPMKAYVAGQGSKVPIANPIGSPGFTAAALSGKPIEPTYADFDRTHQGLMPENFGVPNPLPMAMGNKISNGAYGDTMDAIGVEAANERNRGIITSPVGTFSKNEVEAAQKSFTEHSLNQEQARVRGMMPQAQAKYIADHNYMDSVIANSKMSDNLPMQSNASGDIVKSQPWTPDQQASAKARLGPQKIKGKDLEKAIDAERTKK